MKTVQTIPNCQETEDGGFKCVECEDGYTAKSDNVATVDGGDQNVIICSDDSATCSYDEHSVLGVCTGMHLEASLFNGLYLLQLSMLRNLRQLSNLRTGRPSLRLLRARGLALQRRVL
jgi:hypothetical protein